MIQSIWPDPCPDIGFRPYFQRKVWIVDAYPAGTVRTMYSWYNVHTMYVHCTYSARWDKWDSRIVIPPQGQQTVLNKLHELHPGICRMKTLARRHICGQIWMPTFKAVENCQICQVYCKALEKAPLYPWEHTDDPWVCLHVHYAMPFLNKMSLIIIDSHSKWKDTFQVEGHSCTDQLDNEDHDRLSE